jgi:predicted DsbA family dithiol-disulfide isomerase
MCFQFAICRIPAPVFPSQMLLKITYYLDVISSWCHWSEPTWALLKSRFDEETEFQWKVALMDSSGMPKSRPQLEWFYRRSGTIVGANHTIQSGWYDPQLEEYLAPNLVAEAGLLDGRPTSQLAEAIAAAVAAVPELDDKSLNARASSAEIEQRIRATTAEFHVLQAPQRPTYVLENEIGDRVVFSGIVTPDPLIATIGAMLADAKAQQDYDKSHEPMPR